MPSRRIAKLQGDSCQKGLNAATRGRIGTADIMSATKKLVREATFHLHWEAPPKDVSTTNSQNARKATRTRSPCQTAADNRR